MYSVVEIAGQQHKVTVGDRLKVNLPPDDVSEELNFNRVLLFNSGAEVAIGRPVLDGAVVKARLLTRGKHRKVTVFKFIRTEGYKRTVGHRQRYTEILVTEIAFGSHREVYTPPAPRESPTPATAAAAEKSK